MTEQEQKMELLYPFSDDTMFLEADGTRMPWYTPGAIEYIKNYIPSGLSVLEFGGGHSTLWWRKRMNGAWINTIEANERCAELLCISANTPKRYFAKNNRYKYDVVIVDSEAEIPRQEYIKKAFEICDRYFIVDNWQQPDVCMYDQETVDFLYANTTEQHIFPYPHNGWQTAIFVK